MASLGAYKKYFSPVTLFIIFMVGILLRFAFFESATFGYDQARDAFASIGIFGDDPIKIQGPTTDIKGLFHGPLYWYLTAPFYFFSGGDPLAARLILVMINVLSIFFIFHFSKELFKNTTMALISAFLFAVSFEAVQYSRWLSNPPPALLTIAIFYYGLWLSLQKKSIGIGLMFLGLALSVQFQFFLVYLVPFFLVGAVSFLRKSKFSKLFSKTNIILFFTAFFFLTSFIISEIKFKFQGSGALFSFLTKTGGSSINPQFTVQKMIRFTETLANNVSKNLFDLQPLFATTILALILLVSVWFAVKDKKNREAISFLILWFISPGLIYLFEKNNSYFLNIGNIYPLIMLVSFLITTTVKQLPKITGSLLLVLILSAVTASNVNLIIKNNPNGESLFSVQNKMNLVDEKEAIDWMYSESKDKEFSVNAVTNPLFVHTNWAYLFNWYGRTRYGFMPMWLGYPLDGNFGDKVVFGKENMFVGLTHFLIIEPETGIPSEYVVAYKGYEDARSKVVESRKFGEFTIQKRVLTKKSHFLRQDLLHYLPNQHSLPVDFWENN